MAKATRGAGELDQRVAFDVRIYQPDDKGNEVGIWNEQFRCWARVQPLVGGETVIAGRLQGRQPFIVTVYQSIKTRYVTTEYRLRHLGPSGNIERLYKVRSPPSDVDGDRRFFDIMVEEGVNEG